MGFRVDNGLRYYQFNVFKGHPLFHAVLTRQGGVSKEPFASLNTGGTVGDDSDAVMQNHQRIYETLGFDFSSRYDVWQVHGTEILCTDTPRGPDTPHPKADGILTDNTDVTLFMRFADCVPILLFDPHKKVAGIIHAGWQGTYQKIAKAAVEKMAACYGSDPKDMLVGIGPSICQKCYEVGSEVVAAFERSFGETGQKYFATMNGGHHLDLWTANQEILKSSGVEQIEVAELCTACHLEDWYSHRAEKGKTGRFGVLMATRDN